LKVKEFYNLINIKDMKRIIIMFTVLISIVSGCKEEDRIDLIDNSAPVPMSVTLKEVINTPGGAIIKYTVPNDENLLGVKAVFVRDGQICETKASVYTDSLTMEGFNDTNTYEVNLYSVGRNGKLSEPLQVLVTPLTPPFRLAKVDLVEALGGVSVILSNNNAKGNFSLVLLTDTAGNGEWTHLQTFYTKADSIKFSRRGLPPKEYTFGVYIKDRWNNKSDTITKSLTPIKEDTIPKDKFTNPKFPGDCWEPIGDINNFRFTQLWDGLAVTNDYGFFASKSTYPIPQHFSINLGRKVIISRFQVFPRGSEIYSGDAPRTWELWGSDNPPLDGSWDNWHLLGKYNQVKPSGYGDGADVGPITPEDTEYFRWSGGDYEVEITDETPNADMIVSYIRFKTLSTFATYGTEMQRSSVIIGELTFFGHLVDE
jgi:hypothetical protein